MAWYSGKPADGDLLSASAQYIRENFAELEPLQPHVAELVDLTALQPHVAALLDSRIVDHNLDVADPPSGYYVRFENGLQVCWHIVSDARATTTVTGPLYRDDAVMMWTFPAAFITSPAVYGTVARAVDGNFRAFVALQSVTTTSVTYRDVATATSETLVRDDQLLALGRWK